MTDMKNQPGSDDEPGSEGANAAVGYAGEPTAPAETRELSAEDEGPSPEEFDAREQRFTGPRKPMGPSGDDDVPETTPEETDGS